MKGIIIYKGKYGATRQYAEWISEETGLHALPSSEIGGSRLSEFDFFIIGTSVYIGKLQIAKWLKENQPFLQQKRLFLYQVAATPPEQIEKRLSYNKAGVPPELTANCTYFYYPGKSIRSELSSWDRFLLIAGASMTKDPQEKKYMLSDHNEMDKKHIEDLILQFKKLLSPAAAATQ